MKLTNKEKISYGIGTLGYSLTDNMIVGYLTLFCTECLGIKPVLIGTFILIPKIFDIISDIIIMNKIDKTKSKYGRYKPWLLSSIPLSICLILLFSNPSFLTNETTKLIWIIIIYFITVTIFETIYWCSFATLSNIITNNNQERIKLNSIRAIFENITNILIALIVFPLILKLGTYKNSPGWLYSTIILSIIAVISSLICFKNIKERNSNQKELNNIKIKDKLSILKDKNTRLKIILSSLIFLPMYTYFTLFSYYCIYNLNHPEWVSPLSLIGVIICIIISYLCPIITKKISKKKLISYSIISILLSLIVFILSKSIPSLILFFILKDFGVYNIYICTFTSLGEVTDYYKNKNLNIPGFIFGISSATQKIFMALGTFLATLSLSLGNYNSSLEIQSNKTLIYIKYTIIIIYLIISSLIFILNNNKDNQ